MFPKPLRPTLPPCAEPLAMILPDAPTVTVWAVTVTEPPSPEALAVLALPEVVVPPDPLVGADPSVALAFT